MRALPPILLAFLLAFLSAACGDDDGMTDGGTPVGDGGPADGGDPTLRDDCVHARDGVCDEPVNCPFGSDSTDCGAACAAGGGPELGAACAHRDPPVEPTPDPPPVGSGGTGHVTGHHHGFLEVPSGLNVSSTVPRHYLLYVPASYDPERPAPLVIVMPGHRVGIFNQPGYTEMLRTADANGFLVVFAEQEWRWGDLRWAWWTDWDWSSTRENPDLIFLRGLVERIAGEYNVDRTRVFASGHSRGAAMALIAAFELPDVFAGACSQSGFSEFDWHERLRGRAAGRKVPVVLIHGVADPDVCIDCRPGGTCAVTGRACGSTVAASDEIAAILGDEGWTDEELLYFRLEGVTHRWQPQLNQAWWDFLSARPLPASEVSP